MYQDAVIRKRSFQGVGASLMFINPPDLRRRRNEPSFGIGEHYAAERPQLQLSRKSRLKATFSRVTLGTKELSHHSEPRKEL